MTTRKPKRRKKPSERARRYVDGIYWALLDSAQRCRIYNAYLAGWRAAKKEKK